MMMLPVSKYEELLETVRSLKQQTIRVRELASPLLDTIISANTSAPAGGVSSSDGCDVTDDDCLAWCGPEVGGEDDSGGGTTAACRLRGTKHRDVMNDSFKQRSASAMESLMVDRQHKTSLSAQIYDECQCGSRTEDYKRHDCSCDRHMGTHMSVSSDPESSTGRNVAMLYHGTWPVERAMWNSEPPNLKHHNSNINQADMTSVMSFASSSGAAPLDKVLNGEGLNRPSSQQHLEVKVDMVYSLLSMLGTQECPDMGETLLALSSSPESSLAMRQAGCLPVLVQLVYSEKDKETREKAAKALYNLVQVQPDDKLKKREVKVLRLLEEIRTYGSAITDLQEKETVGKEIANNHPSQVTENIIKLSFDEGYRQTICELGGIYALAHLVEVDHLVHTETPETDQCVTLRRYAGMALTNLTFGHSQNKALLCSFREFMACLVVQLKSHSDELRQVTASVLRNLSWRADASSRTILREVGSVPALMSAAMISRKESTLKSILSALWNLSAHCSMNKADICSVEGALGFLVDMLSYKPPSKTLTIIENAGGILRNISSHIAVREDYRAVLREHNCLQVLLQQLKSPSLTIVSNACGTLWNLSAKCAEDQKALWDMGAAPMLRSLNHSKHIMIATGSRAALKNLLSSRPSHNLFSHVDSTAKELGLPALPTLGARKQRALAKDLDQNLAETCENIEPTSPPLRENFSLGETSKSGSQCHRKFKYPVKKDCESLDSASVTHLKRTSLTHEDNSMIEAFSSLTLSDRCTSKVIDSDSDNTFVRKSQVYQQTSYSSNSLPYTSTNCTRNNRTSTPYIPHMRNKFSDCAFEDEQDTVEQPVDYSQKYSETKLQITKNYSSISQSSSSLKEETSISETTKQKKEYNMYHSKCQKTNVTYSDYAETDLDQPTDYSLRYAENDSDAEDVCKNSVNRSERFYEEQQDTVKTYCTEGTPYETPYNFSTATSMSDLRIDQSAEEDKEKKKDNEKDEVIPADNKDKKFEQPDDKSIPTDNCTNMQQDKKLKSCFSSGLMTPEKPVNYCEEGTPGCFSRVSSFSSLNMEEPSAETKPAKVETDVIVVEDEEKLVNYVEPETEHDTSIPDEAKSETKVDREEAGAAGKVVTFDRVVDYAEETPLMFSRCSSLGSLSSTEQHSIHDDRSSIVSDFSRLTSGIVSPSELPDSPTQTVPPSPRHRKAPLEFPNISDTPPRPQQKSVFEDNVIKYKEVNTPVEFSTNTSLSSLTIDDEPSVPVLSILQNAIARQSNSESSVSAPVSVMDKSSNDDEKNTSNGGGGSSSTDLPPVSEGEEEGEDDMLAACINIGMQNNRHRQNKQLTSPKHRSGIPSALPKYNVKPPSPRTGIPVKSSGIPTRASQQESRLPLTDSRTRPVEPNSDTTRTYCTEDTPAMLSHAGSQSDLSILSISSKDKSGREDKPDFSDDSSNLSGDNDNILAECIQSGMPKARRQLVQPKIVSHKSRPMNNMAARGNIPEPVSSVAVKSSTTIPTRTNDINLQQRIFKNVAYIGAKDEVESYAVEDSPCHFSLRSSLSDLTVDGATAAAQQQQQSRRRDDRGSFDKPEQPYRRDYDPYASPVYMAGSSRDMRKKSPDHRSFSNEASAYARRPEEPSTGLSRQDSLSSLSVDSFGSTENAEQALLEQCISSGMPKSKNISSNKVVMDLVGASSKSLLMKNNTSHNSSNSNRHLNNSTHSSSRHLDSTRHLDSSSRIENSGRHLDTNRYVESNTSRTSSRQHIVETTNRHFDTRYSTDNSVSEAAASEMMMTTTAGSKNVYVASVVTSTTWNEPVQQGPITARATGVAIESRARTDIITDGVLVDGTPRPVHSNKNDHNDTIPVAEVAVNITSTIQSMRNGYNQDNIDSSENIIGQSVKNGYNIQVNTATATTPTSHFHSNQEPATLVNQDITTNSANHSDQTGYSMQTSTPINNKISSQTEQVPFTPGDLYTPTKTHQVSAETSSSFDTSYSYEETDKKYTNSLVQNEHEIVNKPTFIAEYRDIKDKSTVVEGNLVIQTTKTGYKVTENSTKIYHQDTSLQDTAYATAIEKFSTTIDENLLTEEIKSYPDKCSDLLLDGSVEENGELSDSEKNKIAQNRMLDPDAMIESLDRFTAELVSQSSHLQHSHHECKLENMMQSVNECGDTWNDDTSPNDISFPSISISAPLAASFKSDCDQEDQAKNNLDDEEPVDPSDDVVDGRFKSLESNTSSDNAYESNQFEITVKEPEESNQFSSLSTVVDTTMSDSTLIAMEATKIVNVVRSEVEMVQSVTSIASLELDHVKPPSVMESLVSLTSSMSELGHQVASAKNSPVPSRKKSLPAGLMVRRALSNSTHNAKSLENLADNASSVSSSCNLDHVKPPSVMGDYLDMIDMENSMISVASITSEVADVKADFITNGPVTKDLYELNTKNSHSNWLFEVKQPNIMHLLANNTQCHSVTDIENINPPSLLNEVTDLCNSTADIVTENVYSETDVFEDCFTHTIDQTLKNAEDMTEYSDANSITPIQSDFATSSAESTPKKVKNLNRLTPKQRRQLAKERYRTYTVAAEMVIREENKAKLEATYEHCSPDSTTEGTTSGTKYYDNNNSSSNTSFGTPQSPKLTPKERRQLDRARFQTRVLDGTFSPQFSPELTTIGSSASDENQQQQSSPISKLDVRKAMRQKRLENKDRFRTRTLSSDEVSLSPELSPAPDRRNITTDDLHMMLEHEANIVLDTLKQSHQVNGGGDELLDCETLSLVSNDDESEHNSVSSINYRTYHKSWGFSKNLPVVQSSTTDVSNAVTANQDLISSGHIISAENGHVNGETAIDDVSVSEHSEQEQEEEYRASDDDEDKPKNGKPKIVKPGSEPTTAAEDTVNEDDKEAKAIRGRRKALYSSPSKKPNPPSKLITKNIKPIKTMTSNLVKNVTSTLKTNTANKTNTAAKQVKPGLTAKPPVAQVKTFTSKLVNPKANIPKTNARKPSPVANTTESASAPKYERQGTFTKDEKKAATNKVETKIPLPSSANEKAAPKIAVSKIARAVPGKTNPPVTRSIPKPQSSVTAKVQSKIISSTTRTTETASKSTFYTRSPSADRDFGFKSRKTGMHGSTSSQSLQNGDGSKTSYTSKRSSIPNMTQRSNSNVSITSTESNGKKKAVTSKISSLWKRNDDGKKQTQKTTTVTNTNNVKMRNKNSANSDPNNPKRLSRLGSFIQVDEIVVDATPQSLQKTKIPVT